VAHSLILRVSYAVVSRASLLFPSE